MQLAHLSLSNFRNFVRLDTDLDPGISLMVGANGQGKTSLLEAVYYLTGASSPHTSHDRQLINFLALQDPLAVCRLIGEVHHRERDERETDGRITRLEIRLILEGDSDPDSRRLRREVLINGVQKRLSALAGNFLAVMFLPQDMQVIEGSPSGRRRMLDDAILQANPPYAGWLSEYGKVLTQRNALLKKLSEFGGVSAELSYWDDMLADLGAKITRTRALTITQLEILAAPIHDQLTRGTESLRLLFEPSYNPFHSGGSQLNLPLDDPPDWASLSLSTIREGMLKVLEGSRPEEISRGMTLTGPTRDDFRFLSNGVDLNLYGSRGQNRTAMLAVKLAEMGWLAEETGEEPVLLLDEVLAELDQERREDLLQRVQQVQQSLVTSADLSMFTEEFKQQAAIWKIQAGTVTHLSD